MTKPIDTVVVSGVDVGDTHRIIRFLSAEEGRFSAIGLGARNPKKQWAGVFEVGNRVELELRPNTGDLPRISSAKLINYPRRPRTDLWGMAAIAYGTELCAALTGEGVASQKLFGLLEAWLERLETEPVPTLRYALEAKALTFAGLTPKLIHCGRCGLALADPCFFDPASGGAIHAWCGQGVPFLMSLGQELEWARRTPLRDLSSASISSTTVLADFIRWQLGVELRSRVFLDELDGL